MRTDEENEYVFLLDFSVREQRIMLAGVYGTSQRKAGEGLSSF